ncbi:MAG: hypothetical protein LBI73_10660 [Myroides sp.]|jgi:hypothetical protein|uniref:Uncharacterized protein n=1 Tax=Myroides marinus TaxID=703342 RepID=A0A164A0D3_9FLAO|nr:hypothetical protein [Myroides marinus]KUF44381.1 hypothetical protein AS361_03080 [Myroides marinus]KZE82780.1 hypothetical protein AV926_06655 [Myroides marinus]MDR0195572.1 hypothetical protein [Myroides sp.]
MTLNITNRKASSLLQDSSQRDISSSVESVFNEDLILETTLSQSDLEHNITALSSDTFSKEWDLEEDEYWMSY